MILITHQIMRYYPYIGIILNYSVLHYYRYYITTLPWVWTVHSPPQTFHIGPFGGVYLCRVCRRRFPGSPAGWPRSWAGWCWTRRCPGGPRHSTRPWWLPSSAPCHTSGPGSAAASTSQLGDDHKAPPRYTSKPTESFIENTWTGVTERLAWAGVQTYKFCVI